MINSTQKSGSYSLTIVKNAGYSVGGTMFSVFLRLIVGIFITRAIGAESFGIYTLALTILSFAAIVSPLGMGTGMVKFVSEYRATNDIPRLRGTIYWGIILGLVMSFLVSAGLFNYADSVTQRFFHKPALVPVLRIMVISIPFSILAGILLAVLRGAKLIKYNVLVGNILVPVIRLISVALVLILGCRLIGIAWVYVLTAISGALFSSYFLLKCFPEILQKGAVIFERKKVTLFSLPIFFSGIFRLIMGRADVLLIGAFLSASMVGVYGVIQRFLPLMILPLTAFNAIFSPIIAELFASKENETLERLFKSVAKWVMMATLPVFTLLIFFSKELLSIFGPGFAEGSQAMIILCAGQMVNAATGSVGFMLIMTGRPMVNLVNSGILCFANILLNVYLIPKHGIVGAAWAHALSLTAVQLLRLAEVWYFLKIHPYQLDTLKPICSCLLSFLILVMVSHFAEINNCIFAVPLLSILFLTSYIAFLLVLKLSPEDRIVYGKIKDKLLTHRHRYFGDTFGEE